MDPTPIPLPLPVDVVNDWVDYVTLVVAILGVLGTLVIGFFTYRATVKANAANAKATELQAKALERALATAPEEPRSAVRFEISKTGRNSYALRNVGNATAYDVEIEEIVDDDRSPDLYSFSDESVVLEPGAELPFSIERTMVSPAATAALITWHEGDGKWKYSRRIIR